MTRDTIQFLAIWMFVPITVITMICIGVDINDTIKTSLTYFQTFLLVVQIICAILLIKDKHGRI